MRFSFLVSGKKLPEKDFFSLQQEKKQEKKHSFETALCNGSFFLFCIVRGREEGLRVGNKTLTSETIII